MSVFEVRTHTQLEDRVSADIDADGQAWEGLLQAYGHSMSDWCLLVGNSLLEGLGWAAGRATGHG